MYVGLPPPPSPPALTWTHHTETWREPLLNKSRFPLSSPPPLYHQCNRFTGFQKIKKYKITSAFSIFLLCPKFEFKVCSDRGVKGRLGMVGGGSICIYYQTFND